jgi:hypothetical protein
VALLSCQSRLAKLIPLIPRVPATLGMRPEVVEENWAKSPVEVEMLPLGAVLPTQFAPVVQVELEDPLQEIVAPWADTLPARATIVMRRDLA